MPQSTFFALFMVVWVCALVYVLSVFRLAHHVRGMKAAGRGLDAPDIHFNLPHAIPGMVWLLTGRYAKLADPDVVRWARIARGLFFLVLPLMLGMFALAALTVLDPTA